MPSNNEEEEYEYSCFDCSAGLNEDDAYSNEYDGCLRCYDCHRDYVNECESEDDDRDEYIRPYGDKLSPNFLNDDGTSSLYAKKVLYMGIEVEAECVDGDRSEGAQAVLDVINSGRGHERVVYLKEDGSLNYGFEIVSHPATLGFYMNHFAWEGISQLRRLGFKSWNASSCGLHIHLSRAPFMSDKHLTVFVMFLYKNSVPLIQFAGRDSRRYASWDKGQLLNAYNNWSSGDVETEFSLPKFIKWGRTNEDRFTAVNLRNRDTIELRFFRPSLRPDTIKAALQFCDALFNYSSILTIRDMAVNRALDFRSFRSWLDTQDDKYKLLAERIDARNGV